MSDERHLGAETASAEATTGLEVAIVGLSGRFPGAEDAEALWANLCAGKESIRPLAEAELRAAGLTPEQAANPRWVKAAADLSDIDLFDAPFFDFSPREAESIDPQHRLWLECAWATLEDAGIDPARSGGPIGVFVGVSASLYAILNVFPRGGTRDLFGGLLGADKDHLATLTSYKLDLEGPSVAVQSACSSALVAVHFAAQSLLNGECDAALAGGSSILVPQTAGYLWQEGGITSPDGHCRAFDARAAGTVFGNGVGAVLLKRLPDALAARDRIHAVIKGSAVNNDGRSRASYTAPRAAGQAKVIRAAQLLAEVDPKTIRFVEAHGTGTPLGDPIEVSALVEAFGPGVAPGSCALGSIKPNIGHLNAAAGIAGLIKATLALERGEIPKTLHFERPNPALGLAASPFFVNTETIPWPAGPGPRRAAVSSFGMGGTNAHAILEQAPPPPISGPSRPLQLLLLSARTETALDAATDRLAAHLAATSEGAGVSLAPQRLAAAEGARRSEEANDTPTPDALADIAYSLALGRHRFRHRRAVVAGSREEAIERLKSRDAEHASTGKAAERQVHFLFPGQGAPLGGVGRGLYAAEPVFRAEIDRCAEGLAPHLGRDLVALLFAEPDEESAAAFLRTELAQPALFALEWSLARLWQSWGVRPDGLLGHSLGELVAATVAGVFELEDALALVALRGRLMQALPPGAMLAVPLSEEKIAARLGEGLALAAVNGPDLCVVSGTKEAIERFARAIEAEYPFDSEAFPQGLETRRLRTAHAFHSAAMDPALPEYSAAIAKVTRQAPRLPFVSNLTGSWITPEQAVDPEYWAAHLRQTVRFAAGLDTLAANGDAALLEVGPGRTLSTLVRRHPATAAFPALPPLGTLGAPEREPALCLGALGRLWVSGVELDEGALFRSEERRRVKLPSYPFERRRYWIDAVPNYWRSAGTKAAAGEASDGPAVAHPVATAGSIAETSGHARPELSAAYVAPESPTERAVAAVWAELFGYSQVGVHDNFFELGGSSLLATSLAAQLRATLGVEVSLEALFEETTVARLAAWIDARAVLQPIERAPTAEPGAGGTLPDLVETPRQSGAPLSFSQERLWLLDRLVPDNAFYTLGSAQRLAQAVDVPALAAALGEVVRRHETLRASFGDHAGRPLLTIHSSVPVRLPQLHLAALPTARREPEAARASRVELHRSYDLRQAPLMRCVLLRLAPADHVLIYSFHHIVSDGTSLGVFGRELFAIYAAFAARRPSPLPPLPIQFSAVAARQRERFAQGGIDRHLAYWRTKLNRAPITELLADRPRSSTPSHRGVTLRTTVEAEVFLPLAAYARSRSGSTFMALLGGFYALISRYACQTDLVVGVPIAGRSRRDEEGLIGFFVNNLVLRADLSGDPSFGEIFARVRELSLDAYSHQEVPFERLVEELAPRRDLSRNPLFQLMFNLMPRGRDVEEAKKLGGLLLLRSGTAPFDLQVYLFEAPERLEIGWEYATDLFEAATIERLAGHYRNLLGGAVENPEVRLSELPVLAAAERAELLLFGSGEVTPRAGVTSWTVPERFRLQALRTPSATAVVTAAETLDYATLLLRVNRLARRLVALGIGAEAKVGIMVERTAALPVAALGVLTAGASYVPLDPGYPAERLAYMAADAGLSALIVDGASATVGIDAIGATVQTLEVTVGGEVVGGIVGDEEVVVSLAPESLAYTIYTSGSTGRPKGVELSHGALASFLAAMIERPGVGAEDVFVAVTSLSFDIAGLELNAPLLVGARTVIARRDEVADGRLLADLLAASGATILQATPSGWRVLLAAGWTGAPGLTALVGGEALPAALASELRPRVASLWNMYGPTETAVWSTLDEVGPGPIAIGRPVPATRVFVVDPAGQPLPRGVPGELWIGGTGVARGYHARPDLTAERFVPDALSAAIGARLYRTGDLGRFLPDGRLECLGRTDTQVKIRGHRIELLEIERVLDEHPGVAQAAATLFGEGEDRRIAAYVVENPGASLLVGTALRETLVAFLRGRLPEAMIPSSFSRIDRLPLTPNGKVDRKALPAPDSAAGSGAPEAPLTPPRTPIEVLLAGLWQELLGVEKVGVESHFFDLGGHSLLGMRLVSRIREELGVELPLRCLFEAPDLGRLAAAIEQEGVDIPASGDAPLAEIPPVASSPDDRTDPPAPQVAPSPPPVPVAPVRSAAPIPPLVPLVRPDDCPLSFAQERLWFLDRLAPGSPAYNVPAAVRLVGDLLPMALSRALREVVRRHETLRTTFGIAAGKPVQRIAPPGPWRALPAIDLSGLAGAAVEFSAIVRREAMQPFDLERGPLVRATLVRLGAEDHALLVTVHHIVSDAWSMGVLVAELVALYGAYALGLTSPLPELPVQYADFALWQRGWLSGAVLAEQMEYWRQTLEGAPTLALPADRPRTGPPSDRGGRLTSLISSDLAQSLRGFARDHGATLFMLLLAAFEALLARLSGERDLVVGTTIANRARRELEPLIGFFVNTLALRADLTADPPFVSWLGATRRAALDAYAHQDLPYEQLVAEIAPERDLARSPLFSVLFQHQPAPAAAGGDPRLDLDMRPVEMAGQTAKFDLVASVADGGAPGALDLDWRFRADLFDRSTVERWAGHWQRLLAAVVVAAPETRISELPLLSEAERGELVSRWGKAEAAFAPFSLSARFVEQAEIQPDSIALSMAGALLTYGDLARRSETLAQRLLALDVIPGDLVALSVERSLEMVVGILGILRAGAAYVPLDPNYPQERLAYLLEDSGVRVLLTESTTRSSLPPTDARVLLIDAVFELAEPLARRRLPDVPPDLPAYVIYTSGSTGKPKGVVVSHANVARLFVATEPWFDFSPSDTWTLFHSYAFDFSVWELWGPLLYGGRLEVVPYWLSRSPAELLTLLVDERVTVLNQTPSAFRQLQAIEAADEKPADLALRAVVFGGEALELSSLRPWFARHGDQRPTLVNMYGITETCVHVTYRPTAKADTSRGSVIGRAIPDLSAQVVDLWNGIEPAPVGVPGEILVGGAGLALGYLGRPELTAARFVPDPASAVPGARLYRSGDLGRRLPDGDLEYLGRIDNQVKVRGFRIELGEIEAAIVSHPGVRECVVTALGEGGDSRLVAYAVGEAVPALSDLRFFLATRLPDYMVPTALVSLPALPLSAHGKVDRRALPSPERETRSERQRVAPRTPLESWLAEVWAENLGLDVESVGVEDDFFEQGGNSIRGAVLINRLQQDLGEIVHVVVIFDYPTIASLAGYVELEHAEGMARLLAALAAGGAPQIETIPTGLWREGEPLALSFAQERLWFLDRLAPGSAAYNIQTGVRLRGPLDVSALVGALSQVVARHAILRARFGAGGQVPVQTILPVGAPLVRRLDLSALGARGGAVEAEGQRLATLDARQPFDLSAGGLVRLALVRLAPEDHLGLFAMHHIVGDGWSMGLLVHEVGALYAAARTGRPADLPTLAVQYPDFALWQQAQLTPDAVAAELGYWRQVLSRLVPLPLPTDRPRPPILSPEGGLEGFAFAEETVAGLDALAREQGLTRYMALLGSFQALLARLSGESDVAVGSTVAGRTRRELEPLIGFFVNTLVLRARLSIGDSFAALLGQARETALGAFAHQEVPFERVVAELQPEHDLSRSPLFQVMFQLQNARTEVLDLAGLELSSAAAEGATSKFDLVVNLRESPAGISGVWRYSLDLFDRSTLTRWSSHWQHLLAAAVAEPERRWSDLPLLSEAERGELVSTWGKPEITFAPFALSARFAEQAAARPDAIALSLAGRQLTYGDLARRADALGRRLLVAGVLPGDLVALSVERSLEMVVGILGILRAGAAYVPLDPHYPQERLAYLLEDSGVRVLVTERNTLSALPPTGARIVLLDGAPEPSAWTRRLPRVAPDQPAYVIYTSGSTGKPKGVVVTHGNVARLFAATESELEFGPADVWTLFHSFAFDFSVWELWGALLYGGRLEIVPYWVSRSPAELLRLLIDERVTVLSQTPSAFRQLQAIEAGEPTPAAHALSVVVFGGEALDPSSLRPWIARHGEDRPLLVNMYGITETCVHVTYRPLGSADLSGGSVVGRAIPDLSAQVVDLWNRVEPAPVGVPGEILVGGAGLALGYLGRPELTAERFVPDPQAEVPGARLYRSGDLGRRLTSGDLEYLGRIDTQVKVRGFRIELKEIEAAVLSHPGVRECVVLARGGESGDPRLVAYAVGDAVPALSDLRAFLGALLPDYMVPTALVPLSALPLTAHGKVDRRALPEPERLGSERSGSERSRVAPRTPLETWLAGVWAENLGLPVEAVGVEDDFFEQGGNSIRGAVLINRLQESLGEIVQVVVIFDHPTIASLAAYIEAEHGDAAARLLAALAAGDEPAVETIPTGLWCEGEPLALSFAQERLWFLDRLAPGSAAYNIQAGVRLRGPLDAAALVGALGQVVARHAILRARFGTGAEGPVQTIEPAAAQRVPRFDLSALGAALGSAAEREGQRLTTLEARRPFDLSQGGLVRLALVRLAPEDHLGLFAMHHIVGDGWSMGLLVEEVGALYAAARQGKPADLPALAVQYPDFALWQQANLTPDAVAAELGYWREVLSRLVPLPLPTDRPRPPMLSPEGGLEGFVFADDTVAGLDRLAREHGLTRYMALLGSFQALLARISGESDVAVGSTVAGRTRRELEPLIGFFVNTLVLRARLADSADFTALLAQTREAALGAFAHQEVPFERVVAELQPERDLSRSPLFQVMFQLQNARTGTLDLAGLELSSAAAEGETSKFDLVVNLRESAAGISGVWRYSLDLFDRSTLERWSSHWQHLLAAAVAEPERSLAELPLLSAGERKELITEWGKAEGMFEPFALSARFAEQAANRPDAIAVGLGGSVLTYGDLARRSEALAYRLIAAEVAPGDLVALSVERSIEMVVGILGILRAGAAYVPLDPHYPQERLAYLLEDSGVKVLVSEGKTLPSLPPTDASVLLIDAVFERTEPLDRRRLPDVPPELPAYVIYTSGSTGKPKGVVVTHANVARLFTATGGWFDFGASEVWTLFHSYAFDFSVWELWGPLLYGGRLEIVPYWVSRSPGELLRLLVEERVTVLNQTPSAFRQLQAIEAAGVEKADLALRAVVFGGEALELSSLRSWFARHGEVRPSLVNMYGITETTVHVTLRPIRSSDTARGSVIGRAIPDLSAAVVDLWNGVEPAPVGIPGEILVGGAGLALGYLGRPELTAERFVPDPASAAPGARLYRSGDLGRRLPDGDLEYLGRIDTQVKVRGFRIELGEIEAAILAHPGVRECVVVARGGESGDPRLVAYAVGDAVPALSDLRAYLGARLPDYMVPSALVPLRALPLTANGKVDRRALPAPEAQERSARERVAPRTPLEAWLAGIWAENLGLEASAVGVEDDFFEQGGNSIRGAVLINRLQQQLGEIIQVVVIFDHPTIASLAGYLAAEHAAAVERLMVARGGDAASRADIGTGQRQVDEAKLAALAVLVRPLGPPPAGAGSAEKNPPVLFVLSPPRSGTTLLRVMLGGHPALFAPPELELLTFRTMGERRNAFSGRDSFWLEGVLRAVMEIRGGTVEEARDWVAGYEASDLPTQAFYGLLEAELGRRMLVDKTPSYALDPEVLRRGEAEFEGARYLHLVRHPGGMIRSFEEAKLDQIFFRRAHSFGRRELAELIWTASHRNILDFLGRVPNERHHRVIFEELVREPERVLSGVCEFLGLPFEPAMAAPYEDRSSRRMTDGPHAASRALGDVKFLGHGGVQAAVAERWREQLDENELGDPTWEIASELGYEAPAGRVRERAIPARREGWPPGSEAPLSFAQERLWFLDRLMPGSPAYNLPLALRLDGGLDLAVLRSSLAEIVRRHAILRTCYSEIDGRPVQRIGAPGRFPLALADLSALPAERAEREAARTVGTEARRPFDLARSPAARGLLIRFAAAGHGLLLRLHHIAADGWSLGVLVREMVAVYESLAAGQAPALPPLPLQYADYALWQRGWLQGERLDREVEYWRERLSGAPPIALPTDRPRRPARPIQGGRRSLAVLPPGAVEPLLEECRRAGATPFMGLLAVFSALLHRWTGQDDLSLGTPIAGRHRAEIEGLIGLFVNTLVLRVGFAGAPTWRELLARTRSVAVGAFAHQELPFEKVVEELAPVRDLTTAPLFQVSFSLRNATEEMPGGGAGPGGLALAPWRPWEALGKFDLALAFAEGGPAGGMRGGMEYDRELFDPATIARLGARLPLLLEALLARPETPVAELDALAPAERHQLAVEWNDPPGPDAGELTLHELFFRQAARTPERPAVESAEGIRTYAELAARARGISRRLARYGVRPGDRVGLAADRSLDQVAGLLGILDAGAAYVPIDPEYPIERRLYMLRDARVRAVLGGEGARAELAAALGDRVIWLALGGDADASSSSVPPRPAMPADAPAYVIYTSGSTGRPKGVVVPHRAIVNRVVWMAEAHPLAADDRVLYKTPLAFDASIWEIFLPLGAGARVVLAQPGGHRDSGYLVGAVIEHGVTVLQLVPSMLQAFLEEPEVASCTTLRRLFAGGEALSVATVRRASALLPGAPLANLYGPTEAAIDVASNPGVGGSATVLSDAWGRANVPLGRPLSRVRLDVVEPLLELDGEPAGIGSAGELRISGVHLAHGYFDRPDLTAERFVPAQGGEPGARAYRTGDLARRLPDGEIEYLGRIDGQVKVRGVRVEIGEIEAVLRQNPAVAQAAVALRGGGRWLAGFWVAKANAEASPEELSAYLAARLPEAMVPAILVELPALPTLPNGKVDRAALPEPTFVGAADAVAPRTPTEQVLAAIWAEVLGRPDEIGVGDDFFALGGHSLLATRVVARVRGALGVDLPVRALFEHPTIASLARVVDAHRADAGSSVAPPLVSGTRGGATRGLPVSFAQQRLWFLHQLEPESSAYHLPLALRLAGALDVAALGAALVEIARRHEALRTRFPAEDGEPTEEIVPIEIYAARPLPLIDLAALPSAPRAAEARRRVAAEAVLPFDLAAGPVSRTALLRLDREEHVGLLTQHHIVSDAWSRGVLLSELSALYAAAREGRPSPLPPLPIQYADFALWQREWLRGEVLERQINYWRRRLEGIPHVLDLPADRPRPPLQSFRGATRAVRLAPELSRDLRAFARRESATPYMVGLALFQALLCRWTGRAEVLVGSPVANRERLEVEGLIGFFANTLALRGGSAGDLSAALAAARETVLEATAHQDLPFEKLVEELKPSRDPSRSPLVQVLYTLQPQTPSPLALPGLAASPFGGAAGRAAQFDLSLSLVDAPAGPLGPAGIVGGLEFATALFDPTSAARMVGEIEAFFAAAVADPEADLRALSLLSSSERHQLVREWNDGDPAAAPPLVLGFLARHALERPDDPALESVHEPGRRYSWSEVAGRADLIARRLAALGAGPERTVGVSLEWSVDRVLAMLGVWQAGACYLPVDPGLPVERRALLLADAGAVVLITREELQLDLPPGRLPLPLLLGRENGLPERVGPEAAPRAALPENMAYLIYTSGSTGVPKGVAVSQRDAAEHFAAAASFYRLGPTDRVAQFAAASFDVSMEQVGVALASGATLVVRGPDLPPPLELSAWLTRHRITDADLPTAVWAEWSRSDEPLPTGLRVLLTGGEAMPPAAAKRFRARLSEMSAPPAVLNGYGPTEAVVTATCYDVRFGRLPDSGAVSIGRPLPGRFAAVVDPSGRLQELGGIGELVLGGPLARGYLDRPELTAERFRPDSFGEKPGARIYWSGDRVRQRGDGSFDFLGRIDQQVKVRGYRIEPGEIEATLAKHPSVNDAIVHAREVPGAGPRLIAWYRSIEPGTERGAAASVADLRTFLAARLPEYMVPAAFVEVAEWPVTVNGKIDHRALPEPQLDRSTRAFAPPRDAVEEVLAGVWAEVLNLERVGVDEDFFDLGGHSLLATRVVSRVHKVFRMDLPLRDFFGGTTVEGLARIVREKEARPGRAERIARLYSSIERLPDEGVRDQLAARRERDGGDAGMDPANPADTVITADIAEGRSE